MATYKKGVLGAFSGKVGTVVGSTWKSIEYMRSLPRPSKKAPTGLQMEQRAKLALAAGFLKPISSLVNLGYGSLSDRKTGYNLATAQVLAEAITGTYPDFEIDYTKVLFSKGSLTGAWNTVCASDAPGQLNISWIDNSGSGTAKDTDKVILLVYNPAKSQFVFITETGAMRSEATEDILLPAGFSGDMVHVWISFISLEKKDISTSIYAGSIAVA